jgi:hypothetical protein
VSVFTAWCGFVGAWVLVAGPVYQGAVELAEMEVDRTAIRSTAEAVPRPDRVSPWWWLVPPVAYVKISRKQSVWQQQVMASLTPQQRLGFITYSNKAAGWFIVGAGAALIGVEQAVGLTEAMGWPGLTTIPLVLAALAAAAGYTVRRMHLTQRALQAEEPGQ